MRVTRDADGRYAAAKVARPQRRDLLHRAGVIDDSLYMSAERAALPHDVIIGLIKLFSWDVDFQRDVRRGDQFETLFEVVSLEDGSADTRGGDLVYGALSIDGRLLEGYRFELPDGRVAYFDRSGKSLRKFLLRTPMDGARLSSGFGMRRHPILGYTLMHKGRFRRAAGHAHLRGRRGQGRGRQPPRRVRQIHQDPAHRRVQHRVCPSVQVRQGIAPGRRVRQGQVIGYVGTTGRSTGPHLHYEVLRSGAQINPLRLKQPAQPAAGRRRSRALSGRGRAHRPAAGRPAAQHAARQPRPIGAGPTAPAKSAGAWTASWRRPSAGLPTAVRWRRGARFRRPPAALCANRARRRVDVAAPLPARGSRDPGDLGCDMKALRCVDRRRAIRTIGSNSIGGTQALGTRGAQARSAAIGSVKKARALRSPATVVGGENTGKVAPMVLAASWIGLGRRLLFRRQRRGAPGRPAAQPARAERRRRGSPGR